ncbi:MAG: InlB B-repeat-containing protein, partial [Candidatus Izemoplasmatales bacterium]|nr:InlB B-repeat-containing protein [Candidatus Izemoplasmatales bacterium]
SYKIKEIKSNSTQDIYYNDPNHSNKFFQRYYDFNDIGDGVIVGGIITGGHKFSTSANLKSTFNYAGGGSAFLIGGSSGTVNFYGGTISGNSTTALSQWGSKRERSGTVGIRDGGSFNFYDGQIVGNSSRYAGAGIYLFGSSSLPARVNIYGGVIRDNYSLETAYNFQNTSSMFIGGAGLSTDNVGNEASIISISGSPKIVDNMHYDFANNKYISTNMSYSTESVNSIKILDKLYTQNNGTKTYASIGLWGGAGSQLTSNYTVNGNTHEDVNKIFFADDKTKAVAYNTLNGEIQYVTADLKTLTYNANNGTTDTSSISVVDKITVSGSIFTKTGHLFLHWNTSPDDSGTRYSPDDVITLVSNQSLYAIWAKETYRIHYWVNGGTIQGIIPNDYTYGDTMVLPTPSWSGKTFDGWYDNAMLVGSAVTQIDSLSFGDKVYYAKWLGVNEYTITSTAATNGTITPSGSIIYDGISQHYSITPMNGYKIATFTVDGFDRKNDIINNVYEVTGITSNTNIHVTFEKILSTDITVYSTSGDFGTISPKGYSVVSSGSSLTYTITPNPGYRVSYVTVNGISVGAVSSYTLQSITSSQSIHAEFSIMTSPIKFNVNNGSFALGYVAPSVYFEGTGLSLPSLLEVIKTNYSFLGWFDNVDLEGTAITSIDSSQTGAKEYWAKWSINQYTIIFDTNGGSGVSAITQDYDTNVLSPLSPTRTGYTFGGWYANSELTTVSVFSSIPAGNITVYAKWSINQYTITFDSNSGSIVSAITQNYNTDVSTPQNPIKTGYTFGGWYANSELTTAYVFNTMPSENITVYAKWSINQYTITFNSNGGSLVSVITQDYDTSVLTPTSPTRTGYTFGGWYANSELTTAYVFNTMPSENITVFAKWSINQYTISFNSNGGSIVSAITQNYNTAISSPLNPTRIGHTFDGWHSDTDLATLYSFSAMPAQSMTVYAKWSINQYTITFDSNGGSIVSVITLNYDTSVLTPTS